MTRMTAACADCGIDTLRGDLPTDWYMVHDDLWRMAWPTIARRQILCMHCLELRLGRRLAAADFTDAPVNDRIRGWQYSFDFECSHARRGARSK